MGAIKLAVRRIVELALRCGDIDNRYADTSDSMLEGARAHRQIQKSYGSGYQKEVSLSINAEMCGTEVIIQGRTDGVIWEEEGVAVIDEIKTTTMPLDVLLRQREQHLGQAKCYAHMLIRKLEAEPVNARWVNIITDEMTVQLTYYQLETGEMRKHRETFTKEELEAFFLELLKKYEVWMQFERDWKELRNAAIKQTVFPFPSYRRGQRELAVAVYRTIERRRKLYAQAPTGIGKTLSALFPSVKAMAEEKCDKLFYLTAKTVTRSVAEDAVRKMCNNGLRFKSVTLRAKDKICLLNEAICNPEHCQYAKGHYDRVNDALLNMLGSNDVITPEITTQYAMEHKVCPHEFALDAALWADLVIGDYNHVFDPTVYLKRFFSDVNENYVFLIDEAHNLVDRVRDMYTCELRKSWFYNLKKKLKDKNKAAAKLRKTLGAINQYLIDQRKELSEEHMTKRAVREQDEVFNALVMSLLTDAGEWMAQEQYNQHACHEEILELYFEATKFAQISELYDEHYCLIKETSGSEVVLTSYCLDPSAIIAKCLERAKATIMFSATLTPLPYYREMLGGSEDDDIIALPSPFEKERLLLVAHQGISTKYTDRDSSIIPIAQAIYLSVYKKKGNYLVFFPSYEYMSKVHSQFVELFPDVITLLQRNSMDEDERAGFLNKFDEDNEETVLGFCVLGGIFSEGIDLKGERLIGSIIVGVGMPKISMRQDLIRDYFNDKNGHGFDYAYVYPGMNKVLQAAGRVIRTETDFGLVLLIDSRFGTSKYKQLYPEHWSHIKLIRNTSELKSLIDKFPYY